MTMELMDQAGREAAAALKELEGREGTKAGIEALRGWWKEHYLRAGHKRLAKALLGDAKPDKAGRDQTRD